MPNLKISELGAADTLTGDELVELVQGGVNVKATAQDVADLGGGGGESIVYRSYTATALLGNAAGDVFTTTLSGGTIPAQGELRLTTIIDFTGNGDTGAFVLNFGTDTCLLLPSVPLGAFSSGYLRVELKINNRNATNSQAVTGLKILAVGEASGPGAFLTENAIGGTGGVPYLMAEDTTSGLELSISKDDTGNSTVTVTHVSTFVTVIG